MKGADILLCQGVCSSVAVGAAQVGNVNHRIRSSPTLRVRPEAVALWGSLGSWDGEGLGGTMHGRASDCHLGPTGTDQAAAPRSSAAQAHGFLCREPAGILEGRHGGREIRISRELNRARRERATCWGSFSSAAGWPRSDVGAARMCRLRVLFWVVSLQNSNVGVPTPSTSECDLI